jgi:hypothetical protein
MPVLNFYVILLSDGAVSILTHILGRCNLSASWARALSESEHARRQMDGITALIIFSSPAPVADVKTSTW